MLAGGCILWRKLFDINYKARGYLRDWSPKTTLLYSYETRISFLKDCLTTQKKNLFLLLRLFQKFGRKKRFFGEMEFLKRILHTQFKIFWKSDFYQRIVTIFILFQYFSIFFNTFHFYQEKVMFYQKKNSFSFLI